MTLGRLVACLLALIVPLAMTLVAVESAHAAMGSPPTAMAMLASDGHQSPGPAQAPPCRPDCPLVCAPIQHSYTPLLTCCGMPCCG